MDKLNLQTDRPGGIDQNEPPYIHIARPSRTFGAIDLCAHKSHFLSIHCELGN
jgi:hypothetical protein